MGIVGSSGSGKTVCGFTLAKSLLENNIPLWVFDVKRTWRSLAEYLPRSKIRVFTLSRPEISPFCMNFLIPRAGIPADRFDQVNITVADEVLYGGLGSHSILKAAVSRLRALYPMPGSEKDHFTMADVCREVQQISSELRMQKRMADWSATAQRIVAELASAPLGNIINVRRSLMERRTFENFMFRGNLPSNLLQLRLDNGGVPLVANHFISATHHQTDVVSVFALPRGPVHDVPPLPVDFVPVDTDDTRVLAHRHRTARI